MQPCLLDALLMALPSLLGLDVRRQKNMIVVGASDRDDQLASFTNTGRWGPACRLGTQKRAPAWFQAMMLTLLLPLGC